MRTNIKLCQHLEMQQVVKANEVCQDAPLMEIQNESHLTFP